MPIELAASGPAEQPPHRPFRVTGRLVLATRIGFFLVVAGVSQWTERRLLHWHPQYREGAR